MYPFLLKFKLSLCKKFDVFKLLKLSFCTFILRPFPSKGDFFELGGTFSKTSPSIKESRKENEKNLKIGRKKSNCPKKTYHWYFFDLIFSLRDPFFSRFEILSFHQIQLPQIRFSFPIPFSFSFQPHIHFHTKCSPFFIHPDSQNQISCIEQHIKNRADDLWKLTTSSAQRLCVCFLQFGFCDF